MNTSSCRADVAKALKADIKICGVKLAVVLADAEKQKRQSDYIKLHTKKLNKQIQEWENQYHRDDDSSSSSEGIHLYLIIFFYCSIFKLIYWFTKL